MSDFGHDDRMAFNDYQQLALRTLDVKDPYAALTLGALGLAGEAGECVDLIKKFLFHGHTLSEEKMKNELGDVLWYLALLAHQLNIPLEEVAKANIKKLKKRYPKGFSEEASRNRKPDSCANK